MTIEKVMYLYEEYGLAITRDGDKKIFIAEKDKKKSRCFNGTNDFCKTCN